jgi:hypothetical protein
MENVKYAKHEKKKNEKRLAAPNSTYNAAKDAIHFACRLLVLADDGVAKVVLIGLALDKQLHEELRNLRSESRERKRYNKKKMKISEQNRYEYDMNEKVGSPSSPSPPSPPCLEDGSVVDLQVQIVLERGVQVIGHLVLVHFFYQFKKEIKRNNE